ncbi:MFS transporter [Lichenihabitans psoromatis]|uniref:MFS transporter n=1 Tax=Lichenihabitans psoromatis TaxID=2528642 RepID=UPI0010383024|nr:MFS transporter [Lichenihabitans psoromatis]
MHAPSAPQAAIPTDGLPTPQRYVATFAILTAIVLAVLDGAIANVALPTIATTLQVSAAASVWIVTGYQVALVAALLPFAALGESIGFRRVFIGGVLLFTLASACCAFSPNLPVLIASRVLQGLGSAAIMSMIAALLRFTFPYRLLGSAIGMNALVVGLSSAAGPTLGAGILSLASWPWLFAINIPLGLIVLVAARALPITEAHGRRVDLISVGLNIAFLAPLVIGADWLLSRPLIAGLLLAVAAVSLIMLVRRETRQVAPLIPLDLLRGGTFRYSVISSVCMFGAQMLSFVALPFYLQHGLGFDPFMSGLYMTPWPLTVAIAAPLAGRLSDRVSTAILCALGAACMAVGLTLAAVWPLSSSIAPLIAFMVIGGLGFGFFQTPNNRNMLLSAPKARSGAAGGMQATARQFGQTSGAVIMAILFSLFAANAPRIGLGVAAAMALAAAIVSCLRIERPAAKVVEPIRTVT